MPKNRPSAYMKKGGGKQPKPAPCENHFAVLQQGKSRIHHG